MPLGGGLLVAAGLHRLTACLLRMMPVAQPLQVRQVVVVAADNVVALRPRPAASAPVLHDRLTTAPRPGGHLLPSGPPIGREPAPPVRRRPPVPSTHGTEHTPPLDAELPWWAPCGDVCAVSAGCAGVRPASGSVCEMHLIRGDAVTLVPHLRYISLAVYETRLVCASSHRAWEGVGGVGWGLGVGVRRLALAGGAARGCTPAAALPCAAPSFLGLSLAYGVKWLFVGVCVSVWVFVLVAVGLGCPQAVDKAGFGGLHVCEKFVHVCAGGCLCLWWACWVGT